MCDMPLLARYTGAINPKTGKPVVKFIPHRVDGGDYEYFKRRYGKDLLLLPCGKCPSCLKSYAREWSTRLMAEAQYHQKKCFLTLTYDNEHLPKKKAAWTEDGELVSYHPLVKKDLQDFFKRLRFAFSDSKIRYFACGEYGDHPDGSDGFKVLGRPHYHVILFGIEFDDLKLWSYNELGQPSFTSQKLYSIWKNGLCNIAEVSAQSCGYVARYSLKKRITGMDNGEFLVMSRRPAIGYQFYEDHKSDMFLTDKVYVPGIDANSVPRFFCKLAERDDDILVNYHYEMTKRFRERVSEGKEYLNIIAYGYDYMEEGQVVALERAFRGMHTLRRSI